MSYSSDYFNAINKRKKKEEEKKSQSVDKSSNKSSNKSYASEYFEAMQSLESPLDTFMNDIAPVKNQTEQKKQKWYEGWLDTGAFDDGYQAGDLIKTMVSSAADLKSNVAGGALEIGEGLVDSLAYLGGVGAKIAGQNKIAEGVKDFVKEDLYDGKKIASYLVAPEQYALKAMGEDIEDNSIWGNKTDSLAQSAGQLAGTIGLQSVGVPWWVTTGVTSFGGGVEQAFNEGANYAQAGLSSAISAGAEILSEKLFGGSGLGEKGLINVDKLTQGISNKVIKSLFDYGIDVAAEGSEEIVSGVMSNLGTALYKEDNIKDILFSEEAVDEYVQGFIGGAFLGGVMNAGNVKKSVQQKTDYRNGLTANEQKVFDKAYNDAITEAEKSGKKLTGKEKSKIRDNVMENLQKGYISTDTIEGVLGGETFGEYKSLTEQEKALTDEISQLENLPESQITVKQRERLVKAREELENLADKTELKTRLTDGVRNQINAESANLTERGSFLDESYKEIERRKQSFEADLTQYSGKQREAVERAVKSGVLNNTNRSHELVNVLSKIEADKGIVFNYADNAKLKETGFAIDGKTVNGFTKDGAVTLNVQSPKAWQSVVGHEVTHILEGTEAYSELQKSLFAYAESKGELESRKSALAELYNGVDADIDAELTSDLVGDYLFSDRDFIKHLTSNRNVFEKVYDEIKYLFKVATGKEKADIEKVKRQFDKVWEEFTAEDIGESNKVNYSVSADSEGNSLSKGQQEYFKDSKVVDDNGNLLVLYHGSPKGSTTIFDKSKTSKDNDMGQGIYFSTDKVDASDYLGKSRNNKLYTAYVNIKSPFVVSGNVKISLNEVVELLKLCDDRIIASDVYNDLKVNAKDGYVTTDQFANTNISIYMTDILEKSKKYDGIVDETVANKFGLKEGTKHIVALYSNQIKETTNTNPTADADIRYSISEVVDQNKTSYGVGVHLDSTLLDNLSPKERVEMVKEYVKELGGEVFTAYDDNGNATDITIAKSNKRFKNQNGKRTPVNKNLTTKYIGNETKQEAIALVDELIVSAKYSESKSPAYSHGWLDNNGNNDWEYWTTYIQDKNNTIWEATLNVANAADGEKILYDIYPIKKVGQSVKSDTIPTDSSISPIQENVKNNISDNSNVSFSLSNSVEQTKDLIAVHNMQVSDLEKSLQLGGLPMPSIAIIKAQNGHSEYGDVSLVFNKGTIDPQLSKDNKVYGGDAWTPTYPIIEYKANEKVAKRIRDLYYDIAKRQGYDEAKPLYNYAQDLSDELNRNKGEAGLIEYAKDDTKLMQLYLLESGKGKVEDVVKETRTELSQGETEQYDYLINSLGEDVINSIKAPEGSNPLKHRVKFWEQNGEKITEAYKKLLSEEYGFTDEQVANVIEQQKTGDYLKMIMSAYRYLHNGATTVKTEKDFKATQEAIREAVKDTDYKQWVENLFKGSEEKSGIRNNVDYFTPMGNRRSFEATHWENNLENVVRAMKSEVETGGGALISGLGIYGVSAKKYKSIDEIKADSDRLIHISEDEYKEIKRSFGERLGEIANSIMDKTESNPFIANDNACECIVEAIRYSKTKSGILKNLKQYPQLNVTATTVDDIVSLVSDIANMPTEYFEAKPRRAVGFNEVATAIIPDNASEELKKSLTDNGVNYVEYESGNEQARLQVLNSLEDSKFSLSKQGEQPSSVGTPLKDLYYGDDIAPVKETSESATVEDAPMLENIPVLPDEELANGTSEAIKPQPKRNANQDAEPKLKRIDSVKPEQTEQVAKVLTEEPNAEKKKKSVWSKFKSNFIDKGSAVEDLALKTKNRALQDKYKTIGRSEAKAQYFMENGSNGVKSLDDIRSEVEETGHLKEFYEYLYHKHNIDRMSLESREAPNLTRLTKEMQKLKLLDLKENQLKAIASEKVDAKKYPKRAHLVETVREYLASNKVKNKPVFDYSVTAEMSQNAVEQFETAYPEFKAYAQDVYGYMNRLRDMLVEEGVISSETAKLWAETYPYYVPIRRAGYDGASVDVPLYTNRTGVNAPIKSATGGNKDILPLFDTMAQRTLQTFKAIDKNRFGIELKNTLGSTVETAQSNLDEVIDSFDSDNAQDSLLQEGKNGKNPTFTVFENGERVTFEITDELYDALKPTSEGLAYTNKVLNTASSLHKKVLTEYNLFFTARNAIKDAQDVLINSQHPAKTYANFPQALKELVTGKGEYVNEYWENGGEQNTYFDKTTNTFTEEKSTFKKLVGLPLDGISKVNDIVEAIPRLSEYIASRKNGATVDAAMLDAARVTTDFSAGGDVTKFLNRNGATFLNASVQGAAQQVRNIREAKANGLKGVLKLASKYALAGLPALLFNSLMWDDDEEYDELSDYVKDNYYIVGKYGDGQFVRIPKGRTLSVIQELFEQIGNTVSGEESDWGNVFKMAISNVAPNNPIDNNVIAPIIQAATNKTWYGDDLVPTRLQDVPTKEQFDETIDSISKWLGEKTGISPYKINYVINQYSGFVGDMVLPPLTPKAERGDNSLLGNIIAPLKDQFTVDSTLKNQNVADFYNKVDELKVNANSRNATDEDILKNKYMNAINSELSDLYAEKREIQNSNLSDKLKYSRVREIQKQINSMTENGLNTYNDVYIDDNYATVGDKHYKLDDEGKWQKINDEQLEKQKKVTSVLDITPSQYWKNKEEYDYAYKYPEKYAVAKSVGGYDSYKTYSSELYDIKSDKDSNGKSINGSRKEKVIEYVNNLDLDYGAKLILFKSEYPSDDTYNADIVNYVNSRDDLTYEERITIFTELGFTVKNDRVYWD